MGGGHQHNVQGKICAALDMYYVGGGHHERGKGAALDMYQQGEKDRHVLLKIYPFIVCFYRETRTVEYC